MTKKNHNENAVDYSYYSNVLNKPFASIDELRVAEAAHYAEIKAKEDKAAAKKADAAKVEDAFKALNQARREYKEKLTQLTKEYGEELTRMKKAFELGKKDIHNNLAAAEHVYADALKEFTNKYEQYHMCIKDGDFETTISSSRTESKNYENSNTSLLELFDLLFNF